MMSLEYMNSLAHEAAERAQSEGKEPETFVGLGHDGIRTRIRSIPFLGKDAEKDNAPYVPAGWDRCDAPEVPRGLGCPEGYLFVDASGFGGPGEPALTVSEFVNYVYEHRELGFGIVEAGQFQVVIATYRRVH